MEKQVKFEIAMEPMASPRPRFSESGGGMKKAKDFFLCSFNMFIVKCNQVV